MFACELPISDKEPAEFNEGRAQFGYRKGQSKEKYKEWIWALRLETSKPCLKMHPKIKLWTIPGEQIPGHITTFCISANGTELTVLDSL